MPINLHLQNSFYFLICHGNICYDSEMIQQHLPYSNAQHNPFPASLENCRLLSHLHSTLIAFIANNMNPDQTAPLGAV